jgi:hypothetical protein
MSQMDRYCGLATAPLLVQNCNFHKCVFVKM